MVSPTFRDRRDAGEQLAARLANRFMHPDGVVLALPRGGVPVGFEVAKRLHIPLDVAMVRKLGVPFEPELAMGAIATGGIRVLNDCIVRDLRIEPEEIEAVVDRETRELERREARYRHGRPPIPILGLPVILIDDGIATGSTMRVAATAARARGASTVVMATPVAPRSVCDELTVEGYEVVALRIPWTFRAIGEFYDSFVQLTDDAVAGLLDDRDGAGVPDTSNSM